MSVGTQSDRRNPVLSRVPFEALVEIAAPQGASFEAESIDLSATGMHLKTAYLPKVGTPLMFRFEAGADAPPVLAGGEVVWAQDGPEGSEFGVRFAEMKSENADAIKQIIGAQTARAPSPRLEIPSPSMRAASVAPAPVVRTGSVPPAATLAGVGPAHPIRTGAPVRIHIEGVSSPMRATMRQDGGRGAQIGSELKMLRLGAIVELEDKEHRTRRTARVDAVDCEVDDATHVPQLVVKLRYVVQPDAHGAGFESPEDAYVTTMKAPDPMDVLASTATGRGATLPPPPQPTSASASSSVGESDASMPPPNTASTQPRSSLPVGEEPGRFDGVADGMRRVGWAMRGAFSGVGGVAARLGLRAKNTVSLLARSKHDVGDADEVRRTTSPAPGAAGKPRTLRPQGSSRDFLNEGVEEGAMQEIDTKRVTRRRQIAIVSGLALALVLAFFAFRKPKAAVDVAKAPAPELAPAPAPAPLPAPAPTDTAALATIAPAPAPVPLAGEPTGVDAKGTPNPFGATAVKKGTHMVLRLDGPVGELRGAPVPNGFVVAVPNRKSLEAAGPLAAKDPRIASAKVVNQPGGAELTIAFKDDVPSYVVRAKGDALEIVLAKDKAVADKKHDHGSKKSPTKHVKSKKK